MPSPFDAEPAPGPLQGPADGGVGGQDGLTQEEDDGQDHSSTHRHSHPLSRHRVPSGQKVHRQLFLLFLRWYAQSIDCSEKAIVIPKFVFNYRIFLHTIHILKA